MLEIRKAERKKAKLRLALCGVSGSGKTWGALAIAEGLIGEANLQSETRKICVIDTESNSADLYAEDFPNLYDVIELGAPFSPARYIEAIRLAEKAGYEVIIIDSLTHAWAGAGGALDMHQDVTKADPRSNSYAAWRKVTPEHNKLVEAMLTSPSHIIATMRSKADYVTRENEKGRSAPVKIGLAPIQREGMDFEFTVVLDISIEHYCNSSKDRTHLFDGKSFKIKKETGEHLLSWLNSGKDEEAERDVKAKELYTTYKEAIESCKDEEEAKLKAREGWLELKRFGKQGESYQEKIKELVTS